MLSCKLTFAQLQTSDLKFKLNIFLDTKVFAVKDKKPADILVKPKFLIIHGDVSYDYYYRSRMDTPFLQNNFQQHTERVNLKILVNEKYPSQVSFSLRQSNSYYFNNFSDLNFQFDKGEFQRRYRENLLNEIIKTVEKKIDVESIEDAITEKEKELQSLNNWLKSPITLQKIVEEREREFANAKYKADLQHLNGNLVDTSIQVPSFSEGKADSLESKYTESYQQKSAKLDSIKNEIQHLSLKTDSIKSAIQKKILQARKSINEAKSQADLLKVAVENGVQSKSSKKIEPLLLSLKRLNFGRTMVNYTELTAQNIMLTGVNAEFNPSYYAAFVAGKIDYRFRDFYGKSVRNNGQYLVMGRIGLGNPEKRAIILSVFQGKKSFSSNFLNDSATNQITMIGYSLESILKKDENTSLSFEVAKSTKPVVGNLRENKAINALWKFSDQTNLGVNIKAQTLISLTDTRISGFFRKTGKDFQSFSLFSYNSDQVAWLARIDQSFLKEKVSISGMIRRNDFTNPFTEKTFKTSTVFKSIMVNIRIPKLPFLSIGYYPGSQLYVVDKDVIQESVYYMLNGSLTYSYFYKGHSMSTSFMYNKYLNQATDSSFSYYRGVNYYLSHSISFNKLQLQGGYAFSKRPELVYHTLESFADYSFKKYLRAGGGLKYNKVVGDNPYWGWRFQSSIDLKSLGFFKFQYEKSFLPTISKSLFPVVTGRIFWFKYF